MFIKTIIWTVIFICTIKTAGYGVYVVKKNNKTGALALFIMAFLTAVCAAVFI